MNRTRMREKAIKKLKAEAPVYTIPTVEHFFNLLAPGLEARSSEILVIPPFFTTAFMVGFMSPSVASLESLKVRAIELLRRRIGIVYLSDDLETGSTWLSTLKKELDPALVLTDYNFFESLKNHTFFPGVKTALSELLARPQAKDL